MPIPLTLAFAVTEDKVQKAMFKSAILDPQCNNITTNKSHKVFCSIYIHLFCSLSLDGNQLLQNINQKDINNKPNLYL